jgi:hypothetical protein
MISVQIRLPDGAHGVTVRNMNKRQPNGMATYRVIVDDGEDLFTVFHHRTEGFEELLAIVFRTMYFRKHCRGNMS